MTLRDAESLYYYTQYASLTSHPVGSERKVDNEIGVQGRHEIYPGKPRAYQIKGQARAHRCNRCCSRGAATIEPELQSVVHMFR